MTYVPIDRGTEDWDVPLNAALSDQDTRIQQNTADISTNTNDILTMDAQVDTNTANIATNTSNIATNTSNIATNTSGISTLNGQMTTANTNISTLQGQMTTANTNITALQGRGNDSLVQGFISWNYDSEIQNGGNLITLGTVFLHKLYIPAGPTINNLGAVVTTAGNTLTYARAALFNGSGTQLGISVDQTTNWASTGFKVNATTAPISISTAGFYYVALLNTGTTGATFASTPGTSNAFNANTTGATLRHATGPTGQTSMPASITMSSNISTGASIWCAVY
jgi:hypothetical protein